MSWQAVALVAFNTTQIIALAWIAAWQQRAKHELEKLNGAATEIIAARDTKTD